MAAEGLSLQTSLALTAADASALRPVLNPPGSSKPAPVKLTAKTSLRGGDLAFDEIAGTVAGTPVGGRLALAVGGALPRLDGRLDIEALDASALVGALAGMPQAKATRAGAAWPAAPLDIGFMRGVTGQVELRAASAALTPATAIKAFTATLRLAEETAALDDVRGTLAGGALRGQIRLQWRPDGLGVDAAIGITGSDIAALVPGAKPSPIGGRVSLQLEGKGAGRSPAALAGSLTGNGALSFDKVVVKGLEASVFETVARAADQSPVLDVARVKALAERTLAAGRLPLAHGDGALTMTAGQVRLSNMLASGDGAEVAVAGAVDLAAWTLDGRVSLSGPGKADDPAIGRPEILVALSGPLAAPKMSTDVSTLVGWLTLRSVEQQAKRLEEAEAERRRTEEKLLEMERRAAKEKAAADAKAAAQAKADAEAKAKSDAKAAEAKAAADAKAAEVKAAQARAAEARAVEIKAAADARAARAAENATGGMERSPASIPLPTRRPSAPAASEQAPTLPPPLEIRPAPHPRRPSAARRAPAPPLEIMRPESERSRTVFETLCFR